MTVIEATITGTCANPNCDATAFNGARCPTCQSYRRTMGCERPERLVRYPGRGHNLLGTRELVDLMGATYRQVDWLSRAGICSATIEADGTGTTRGYDLHAATVVAVHLVIPQEMRREIDVDPRDDTFRVAGPHWQFSVDVKAIRERLRRRWPTGRDLFLPAEVPA